MDTINPKNIVLVDKPECNYFRVYEVDAGDYKDPSILFSDYKTSLLNKIKKNIKEYNGIKFSVGLSLQFYHDEHNGKKKDISASNHGKQAAVLNDENIEEHYDNQTSYLLEWIEKFTKKATGLEIDHCIKLYLNIAKYEPLKGSSYIELLNIIKNKKAVINIKNKDNACLFRAVVSALYPAHKNSDRPSSYPGYKDILNIKDIDTPTPLSQINKLEKQNNLSINVYGPKVSFDNKLTIFPYYISDQPKDIKRINLLLISEEENNHYCWIKNLNRLLCNQNNKHNEQTHFCDRCLYGFTKEDLLINHKEDCEGINKSPMRIEMPEKDKNFIEFKNPQNQMSVPYVIYADHESIILGKSGQIGKKTKVTSEHQACGVGYQAVRYDNKAEEPVVYRGSDSVEVFLKSLEKEVEKINEIFKHPEPLIMTEQNKKDFENATNCWICEKEIEEDKVRDHCHFTGEYRGAAHKACNLKLKIKPYSTKIPVIFHNLKGYDSHLIMQKIHISKGNISCIANNSEKYISFSIGQLTFLDSFQFNPTSLEKLVEGVIGTTSNCLKCEKTEEKYIHKEWMLTTKCEKCHTVRRKQLNKSDLLPLTSKYMDNSYLFTQKGIYPYEYIDSFEKFNETELPSKDKFYSSLTNKNIKQKEYEYAQKVWKETNCRNIGDYHDIYLKSDILLLADVVQNFRETCMKAYKLDPMHYYTAPGLSWDALLKCTKVKLELLTDIDMHLFIEKGMRGGISMVSKRYSKANNPYVKSSYDKDGEIVYILYLDANNLYGWSMSHSLPYRGFKWVKIKEDGTLPLLKKGRGRIYEVDLEYPKELHDLHNDYPLAPDKIKVKKEWLSDYQKELLGKDNILNVEKLVPNLMDKEKYVVHYKNLEFYVKMGLKVKKIHRVLEFDEKPWMEPYIRLNTEFRKKAKTDFEKDFYKLMNNSVFGKTMENIRKRVNIKLVKTDGSQNEKIRKIVAKPSYNGRVKFSDDLSALHVNITHMTFNKPIYVGFSILELSKYFMYGLYYNALKKKYGENCSLLYTDTDSLLVEIKTEDVYKDMREMKDEYDLSNYPKDHFLHDGTNKKVIGKMKDECAGIPIKEYVGLRPKLYAILKENNEDIKKAKGTKKYVIEGEINYENFKDSLFNKKTYEHSMNMIRSIHHIIHGLTVNKITLSPLDTKKYTAVDGIMTYAYGYQQEQ